MSSIVGLFAERSAADTAVALRDEAGHDAGEVAIMSSTGEPT